MHDFHHNYIKKKYGNKAKLLFTNKDSLAFEIETNKSFEYFAKIKTSLILVSIQKIFKFL